MKTKELSVIICSLKAPLLGFTEQFTVSISTNDDVLIAKEDYLARSNLPFIFEKFNYAFENFYFGENFELKIEMDFPKVYDNVIKGFFAIKFPDEYFLDLKSTII